MAQISHKIFIETSFFISFIDRASLEHLKSVALLEFLGKNNYQVYTSNLVILQTFTRLEREMGATVAMEFLQAILESNIETLYFTRSELIASFRYIRVNSQRRYALSEIINSIMMEKHGINGVLTYDFWHSLMGTQVSQLIQNR